MKCLTMILLITIFLVSCQTQQQAPLMPEATAGASPIPTITPTVTAQATNTSQVTAVSPTNALQLAQKGQELYEDAPLLGLGLALEAWSLIPPENGAVKDPIIKLIQEMAAQGRLLKLGDDVENVKPSPDGANFLVHRQNLLTTYPIFGG